MEFSEANEIAKPLIIGARTEPSSIPSICLRSLGTYMTDPAYRLVLLFFANFLNLIRSLSPFG